MTKKKTKEAQQTVIEDQNKQNPNEIIKIEELENLPTLVKHTSIRRGIANKAALRELYNKGLTDVKALSKVLKLKPCYVSELIKNLKDANLSDPQFVSKAALALDRHLDENNLEAVKMVYKHINRDTVQQGAPSVQNTRINISFEGLSNPQSTKIISNKVTDHKTDTIIDATIVKDKA
jgi:hypothetical protein